MHYLQNVVTQILSLTCLLYRLKGAFKVWSHPLYPVFQLSNTIDSFSHQPMTMCKDFRTSLFVNYYAQPLLGYLVNVSL